ncbi:hypothetical protein NDU88_006173 [Pleurodeles waltl]|uniref:Uncharacterized protein n=1 Tax=Pleurodeles waltl TaxID=8319 RepID=A0AAV7MBG4_PLEWA|nr:hypothetical protein NDU88_006173 [Pleurodeles waltl]
MLDADHGEAPLSHEKKMKDSRDKMPTAGSTMEHDRSTMKDASRMRGTVGQTERDKQATRQASNPFFRGYPAARGEGASLK